MFLRKLQVGLHRFPVLPQSLNLGLALRPFRLLAASADVNLGRAGRQAQGGVLPTVEEEMRTDAFVS